MTTDITKSDSAGSACPLCEALLAVRRLSEAAGDEAPIRVTLRNLPVLACEAPHRYFVGHGFPVWLLNSLLERALREIPAGKTQGPLFFRKHACGGCGAILPAGSASAKTFTTLLAWKQTPAFRADISVPLYRCPSCSREQARSADELAKLLPAALVHAFKSAGIKSPG